MGTRLVVSGQDQHGKSIIVSDEVIEPVDKGLPTLLWGSDRVPQFPMSGRREKYPNLFPTAGGYRFLIFTLAPNFPAGSSEPLPELSTLNQMGGAVDALFEKDVPGMHTTDTVDFEVVLSGEASLELDDGKMVHLKQGECFIQNGTRHRWFNRGTVPAVIACAVIGGDPRRK
jgi:mannose-6-phosphate isomerase-like protein (cupin superfamily)